MNGEVSSLKLERYWGAIGLSTVLAVLIYFGGAVYSGWQDVWSAAFRIGMAGIVVALLLSLFNYGFRFARWARFISTLACSLPWRVNLEIYLAGFALSTTPGKTGELVRCLLLKRQGMGYSASAAAFMAERTSDLMALLALLAMAAFLGGLSHPEFWFAALIAIALLAGLFFILGRTTTIGWFHHWLESAGWQRMAKLASLGVSMSEHFQLCAKSSPFWWGLVFGILAWGAEGTGFYVITQLAGASTIGWGQAVFIYTFATLVGALTFLPGGLGSAEAVMAGLMLTLGVGQGEAVAITIIARMATLWFGVSIGIAALVRAARVRHESTANKQLTNT